MMAFEQLESTWPVHGSVLLHVGFGTDSAIAEFAPLEVSQ